VLILLFSACIALAIRLLHISHQPGLHDQVPRVPVRFIARTTGSGSVMGTLRQRHAQVLARVAEWTWFRLRTPLGDPRGLPLAYRYSKWGRPQLGMR